VLISTPDEPIGVTFFPRRVQGYGVIDSELQMLRTSYSSNHQAFFGFTAGVAASGVFSLLAGTFPVAVFALIGAISFVASVMAIYFFFRMREDQRQAQALVDQIRATVRPLA
jgi:hypothetical protein